MRASIALGALLLFAVGCCQSAGRGVGGGVTNFTQGVGQGVDEGVLVTLKVADGAAAAGIGSNTAKQSGKKVQAYLTSKNAFNGQLIVRALNKDGLEIGRSVQPITMAANDAKYFAFQFPQEMDTQLVTEYRLDIHK